MELDTGQMSVIADTIPSVVADSSTYPQTDRRNILVAEDDVAIRTLLSDILSSEGYTVAAAENGQQALKKFDEVSPTFNLVITDLMMPDMDGETLIQTLRSNRGYRGGIIVITATSSSISTVEKRLSGFVDQVHIKPFDLDTFLNSVQRYSHRLHNPQAPINLPTNGVVYTPPNLPEPQL